MSDTKELAVELASRPYFLVVLRDKATDDDFIYLARNPELEGCMAQGETMEEAQDNLDEVRVDLIRHLLEHNLPVPDPAWMATKTESEAHSIKLDYLERETLTIDNVLERVSQPEDREVLFEALLRT